MAGIKRKPCGKCVICDGKFAAINSIGRRDPQKTTCSPECSHKLRLQIKRRSHWKNRDKIIPRLREYHAKTRKPSPLLFKCCVICGSDFEAIDPRGRKCPRMIVCSESCRKQHACEKERQLRSRDPEKANRRTREWRRRNPDKVRESQRKNRLQNVDKIRERELRYRRLNPEKIREHNAAGHMRRQAKINALRDLEAALSQLEQTGVSL